MPSFANCTNRLSAWGPGNSRSISTPRRAALVMPVDDLGVGHEVHRSRSGQRCARAGAAFGRACRCRCLLLRTPRECIGRWRPRVGAGRGRRSTKSSKIAGSVSDQLSRKAARSPSTAGPVIRKWVSRQQCSFSALPKPFIGDTYATPVGSGRFVDDQNLAMRAMVQLRRDAGVATAGTSGPRRRRLPTGR